MTLSYLCQHCGEKFEDAYRAEKHEETCGEKPSRLSEEYGWEPS